MGSKSFLIVSLDKGESEKLAQVLSNKTARKILDYLGTTNSVTESQIAESLGLPLSTVHYNLKLLMETKLVKSDEFHYSKKGREVNHYSIANKYIIISPKPVYGLKSKLKKILPVLAIMVLYGLICTIITKFLRSSSLTTPALETRAAALNLVKESSPSFDMAAYPHVPWFWWFVIGGTVALVLYIIIDYMYYKYINKEAEK